MLPSLHLDLPEQETSRVHRRPHKDVPDAVIEAIEVAWLREAIGRLPQKACYVLLRRYGLDDRDPATLAAELKLSRERIRQLQRETEFLLKSGTKRVPRPSVARGCSTPKVLA